MGGLLLMRSATLSLARLTALALLAAACSQKKETPSTVPLGRAPATASGTTFPQPGADNPGEWARAGRDYAGTRYSPLDQITTANVANLKVAWTFSTGVLNGHEGQPLVVGSTMYVTTPWPNITYALDLADAHAPAKWALAPPTVSAAKGEACCDVVNRGAAYGDGKIVWNMLDGNTIAADAKTGKQLWKTKLADINKGETMTMAPLIVKNKVFVGVSGAEMGVRGWIAALDLGDGHVVWKAYSTGSDKDVLIGSDFKPFYAFMRGTDLGVKTWPANQWKLGGGTVWGWITYDPETNLIFYGTGNPGAWNPDLRPGDNLWSMTIFARDPDTGAAKWAYQMTPHDMWDYDGVNESIVADIDIDGKPRKVLLHAERNGFAYVIDRTNGEVINAQPFVFTNWATGIDLQTGRPKYVPDEDDAAGSDDPQHLPVLHRRKGSAAHLVVAAHEALVHPGDERLHGLRGHRGELHCGHAVPRRGRAHVRGAGRQSRRARCVGSRAGKEGVGREGELPALERHARHGRRCAVLRHDGRVGEGGGRAKRTAALELQDRLGCDRQSHLLRRSGRQTVRRDLHRRGRMDGCDRIGESLARRSHRGARRDRSGARSQALHRAGRHALRVRPMRRALVIAGCAAAVVAACQRDEGRELPHGAPTGVAITPVSDTAGGVMPGIHSRVAYGALRNPYTGNAQAERDGRQLFLSYNCVGCHGGRAGGGMGPSLRDSAWIYGNTDADLFGTITEGRPNGMPTWGGKIPEDQIWKLISYIRTLRTSAEPDPPPPATQPNR